MDLGNAGLLEIILKAKDEASEKIKQVGEAVDKTSQKTQSWGTAFKVAGGLITGAGIAGVGIMKDLADAGSQYQVAIAKSDALLGAFVKTSGNQIGSFQTLKDLTEKVADSYIKLGFKATETNNAFAQDLVVTKNVANAKTMLSAAADLARYKHIELSDATTAVTRAYEGNLKALKALGIELPKGAKGMEVVQALQGRLGGQAEAYSNTYAGAQERMAASLDKFRESLGVRFLPILTGFITHLSGVIEKLNTLSPATLDIIAKVLLFGTAFALIAGPILILIGFLPMLAGGFALLSTSLIPLLIPIGLIVLGVIALGVAAYLLITHWSQVSTFFVSLKNNIGNIFSELGTNIHNFITKFTDILSTLKHIFIDFFTGGDITLKKGEFGFASFVIMLNKFRDTVGNVFEFAKKALLLYLTPYILAFNLIKAVTMDVINFITPLIQFAMILIGDAITIGLALIKIAWNDVFDFFAPKVKAVFNLVSSLINIEINYIKTVISIALSFIKAIWTDVFDFFAPKVGAVFNAIGTIVNAGFSWVGDRFSSLGSWVHGIWNSLWGGVSNTGKGWLDTITNGISNFINGAKNLFLGFVKDVETILKSIHIPSPHLSKSSMDVAGQKITLPKLDWYQNGGWVNNTGLAVVHAGEYVLSKNMLSGQQPIGAPVNNYNSSQPITIAATINNPLDIDAVVRKLSFELKFNSRI